MAFSGALTLTDLNDFITPSQACIKPVEQVNPASAAEPGAASTQIHVDSSGSYYEVPGNERSINGGVGVGRKLETAQISLNDCLACSGCITSAESVLITMQSHEEVLGFLSNNPPSSSPDHRIPVISIAPQSLASLSASLSSSSRTPLTLKQVFRRLEVFCRQVLGFAHVYDTTFARHIALLEHSSEFHERKRLKDRGQTDLPMLASACPGWICYAEKTHAEMLPFISRTKSPQQIMGTLVKNWLGSKWDKTPDRIYHVTVMPCYDKKLEASRQDFYNDLYSTRDVDCVLTTGELELMIREKGWDLSIPVPLELRDVSSLKSPSLANDTEFPDLLSHPGSSSGSYLATLVTEHMSVFPDAELTTQTMRSSDYEEFVVTNKATSEIVFKGAKCYGFRNLQNVVRKIGKNAGIQVGRGAAGRLAAVRARKAVTVRSGKGSGREGGGEGTVGRGYDYVEVMACPSGCINGGGQIKPSQPSGSKLDGVVPIEPKEELGISIDTRMQNAARWGDKEWTKRVEATYWHDLPTPPPSPPPFEDGSEQPITSLFEFADKLAVRILKDLCKPTNCDLSNWSSPMDDNAEVIRRSLFRTQYRAVESDVIGLQVKW